MKLVVVPPIEIRSQNSIRGCFSIVWSLDLSESVTSGGVPDTTSR